MSDAAVSAAVGVALLGSLPSPKTFYVAVGGKEEVIFVD